jgi:hypothetical protein
MAEDVLRYDKMVENALRGVLKEALSLVEKQGLLGEHHFYITFRTKFPGTAIPKFMLARHPEEMTIVLQHQFWDLKVHDEFFEVTLSFNQVPERCVVPFAAVTAFADPSSKFGLQFQTEEEDESDLDELAAKEDSSEAPAPEPKAEAREEERGQVITLDAFRKK